jgi:HYR domain/Secretion system C-terminal sorting domain
MRISSVLFFFGLLFATTAQAQVTTNLILSDFNSTVIDAQPASLDPTLTTGNSTGLSVYTWTQGGIVNITRPYIKFDLSSIPSNAQIQSAQLVMEWNLGILSTGGTHQGDNGFLVQRVTANWDENTITWANQPPATSTNQLQIPVSTNERQNYCIDVTQMVKDMQVNGNHGFVFKLVTEDVFRSVHLASSENPDCSRRPRLMITYQTGTTPPTACAGSILQNGNLDPGLLTNFWQVKQFIPTTDANSAPNAASLTGNGGFIRQLVPGIAGTTYTLSAFGKSAVAGTFGSGNIKFLRADWFPLGSHDIPYNLTTNWSALAPLTATAPAGTKWVQITLSNTTSSSTVSYDDICLTTGQSSCANDITAPVAQCPAAVAVTTAGTSAVATWQAATATDNCTASPSLQSNYLSGASFPLGTTQVVYTATDQAGNTGTCSFQVMVTPNNTQGADLQLSVAPGSPTVPQWSTFSYRIIAKNTGSQPILSATIQYGICNGTTVNGKLIKFASPSGIVYGSVPTAPGTSTLDYVDQVWTIANLAPGQEIALEMQLFTLDAKEKKLMAYTSAQSPNDPDSQPSLTHPVGCVAQQDDEVVRIINQGQFNLVLGSNPQADDVQEQVFESVVVFPNPTADRISVAGLEASIATKVRIFDAFGKVVLSKSIEKSEMIESFDLGSQAPSGLYSIEIIQEGKRPQVRKVVVQKSE